MSAVHTVYYCYAVARPFPTEKLGQLRGVRDTPVEAIADGDLVVVASPVPAAEFGETALRANLEDLGWLEEVARSHNAVVDYVADISVTVPFRLATIYWDADRVRDVLRTGRTRLATALDRIDGRTEWGVKVYSLKRPDRTEGRTAGSGRAFLRKRMEQRDTNENSLRQAEDNAAVVDEAATALSDARRRHRPQNPALSGASGQNVFNAAYLVPTGQEQDLATSIAELRERLPECQIELTGPWAPYSFSLEKEPEEQ